MRRRFSYANVAATLALVLAMSGGAFAAGHYLINSTKQINPKVLRKLHGARGARGAAGQNGPVGPQGVTGATGTRGARGVEGEPGFSALSNLKPGGSESGDFALIWQAEKAGENIRTAVTFSIPLEVPVAVGQVEFTPVGTPGEKGHCPNPGAALKGWLCVYTSLEENAHSPGTFDPEAKPGVTESPGKFGSGLSWAAVGPGQVSVAGTYTVTAP
jgi:Collagen triple helix repeat (20 copies)